MLSNFITSVTNKEIEIEVPTKKEERQIYREMEKTEGQTPRREKRKNV